MRGNFFKQARPANKDDFFRQTGPANEGRFFQQAGLDWHMRGDFLTGPGRVGKKEMSFSKAGPGYKKKKKGKINNITSQFGKTKQRLSIQAFG